MLCLRVRKDSRNSSRRTMARELWPSERTDDFLRREGVIVHGDRKYYEIANMVGGRRVNRRHKHRSRRVGRLRSTPSLLECRHMSRDGVMPVNN